MTDNIRKILADSLSSLVVAYEGESERVQHEMECLDEKLSDCQGRLSDSVKDAKRVEDDLRADLDAVRAELVATQAKLATMPHRPGAFAESVEAESRLVAEAERRKADHEAVVRRLEGERDDWKLRAEKAERDYHTELRHAQGIEGDGYRITLGPCHTHGPSCFFASTNVGGLDVASSHATTRTHAQLLAFMALARHTIDGRHAVAKFGAGDAIDKLEKALQDERTAHNATMVKLREAQSERRAKDVVAEIAVERCRQKTENGWTEAHDDGHAVGELAWAAVHYAAPDLNRFDVDIWPFNSRPKLYGMGPTGRRKELIVAAALLVAEIERLDRSASKAKAPAFDRKPDGGSTFVGGPLSAPVIPGIPCQPPEEVARGVLDLERAEARDATGRAP